MRFFTLGLALALLALSTLTWREIPAWVNWRLGVLVGEYGHLLALASSAVFVATLIARVEFPWALPAGVMALAATALFLKPAWQAMNLARTLPATFEPVFAPAPNSVPAAPFRWTRLFAAAPARRAVRTLRFAPGLELDYYAAAGRATAPCVIVIHAGGWDNGDQHQLEPFNQALADAGYAVAAITYRLAPQFRWPAQREDTLAALAFLKAHASELRLDPKRFVLLGRSAGGHIAEAVGYTANDPTIRGVVGLYAPADLEFAWTCGQVDKVLDSPQLMRHLIGASYEESPAAFRAASGYFHVTDRAPPTLLMHGQLDPLVWHRQSERLAQRLAEHHVPHVFISLPWATHAFEYNVRGPGGQLTLWAVERFLAAVTA